jgi:hypothetical protein
VALGTGKESRDPSVHGWFQRAVELSGDDGPIQQKSIRDVVAMAPGWRAHEERIGDLLQRGEAPLFFAAESLNVDFVRATLGRALANSEQPDATRRSPILAFDGARKEPEVLKDVNVVAADVSSLMTLGFLGAMDLLVRGFSKVVIAPGTLALLFEERQRVRFHQPSRVERAKRLRKLLDDGNLKVFATPSSLPADLLAEVGEDLAGMLLAAAADGGIVVRPAPLHKAGSLMETLADVGAFAAQLTDTRQVLAYAKAEALLKSELAHDATLYIMAADAGLPGAVPVETGRNVYLDDLAVSYLEYTQTLEPFCRKHGRVFIPASLENEINALIAHEQFAAKVLDCIEHVRAALATGLDDRTVVVADVEGGGDEEETTVDGPTVALLRTTTPVEAMVVDDKFINRHVTFTARFGQAKVATTLDVLDELVRREEIVPDRLHRLRRDLREAAYALVGIDEAELLALLGAASAKDGKLIETRELRILRENVLLVIARKVLLPREEPWVASLAKAQLMAVRTIWTKGLKHPRAKSNWILRMLPDPWQFCPTPLQPGVWDNVRRLMAARLTLLFNGISIPDDRRQAYLGWVESDVLRPLQLTDAELFASAVENFKEVLKGVLDGTDD